MCVCVNPCPCLPTAGIDWLGNGWLIEISPKGKSTSTSINLRPQTAVLMEPAFTYESQLTSLSDDSITERRVRPQVKTFFLIFFFLTTKYTNRSWCKKMKQQILHPDALEMWKNQSIYSWVLLIHKLTFLMMMVIASSDRYKQGEQTLKCWSSNKGTAGRDCAEWGKEKLPRKMTFLSCRCRDRFCN